jgi:hypothetical protein
MSKTGLFLGRRETGRYTQLHWRVGNLPRGTCRRKSSVQLGDGSEASQENKLPGGFAFPKSPVRSRECCAVAKVGEVCKSALAAQRQLGSVISEKLEVLVFSVPWYVCPGTDYQDHGHSYQPVTRY